MEQETLSNSSRPAIEWTELESRHSRKRLLFRREISNISILNLICITAISDFEIVYKDTCSERILSDTWLVILQ